jgi:DNA repair exonuclease SbcCD ATPase subunit
MLIEGLEIEAIGPFRDRLELGPFDQGLNVIAQPNEWGKSTLIKALSRAFFDRYSSGAEAIRQLRPAGTTLSPRVAVTFASKGARFRLMKRFLDGKSSELFRWSGGAWELTDESDRADQRVRELLGAPPLEGVTPKLETWGFVRYLWARQDEPAEWPSWDGPAGDAARRRLATVPIDAAVRSLLSRFQERAGLLFTGTGRVKGGGELDRAEKARDAVLSELNEVRSRRAALEELEREHAGLVAALPLLEKERVAKAEEATRARQEAEAAEKLLVRIKQLESDWRQADASLQQVTRDRDARTEILEATKGSARERDAAEKALEEAEAARSPAERELQGVQVEKRERAKERLVIDEGLRRVRALLRLRMRADEVSSLRAAKDRAAGFAVELKELEELRGKLPVVSAKQIEQWRKLERELQQNRARLEALGLRVTLRPDRKARVETESAGMKGQHDLPAGMEETLKAARELQVRIDGWGTVEIRSGAEDVAELEGRVSAQAAELSSALAEARANSLAEAEANLESARDLEQRMRETRKAVAAVLGDWDSLATLESALGKAEAARERECKELAPTEAEAAASGAVLQAEEESLQASLRPMEREVTRLDEQIESARLKIESLREKREAAREARARIEARAKGLTEQLGLLDRRHPRGLAAALEEAQNEFVRAEARLEEARRQLPPNTAQLPARNVRAANAAKAVDLEFEQKSNELRRLETRLEERGGDGLHSREADLEEKLAAVQVEAKRLRDDGGSARLLCDLIQRREERAVQAVLGPLENRLSEVFAALTGVSERRVWFDELLQIRGVGPRPDALVPFAQLSRGAREQLLLALRAAIALELSVDGRECLILDDVLVHTDGMRHENVLDYLQQLAGSLQIVVLTCHAERYRGVGRLITAER